ncbi:hypothetical protein GCM10010446_33060 [Streptomyces enissocaesilis]|uniref:Histidine kinase/HSP90-like ATPase domain-containing protein n=1 Tax=Streptomyces enissocaesilis TaxID=332589 RepID=A0ABP6JUT0_9ACTN
MGEAPDFPFGSTVRIRMDRWPKGRVASLGDAGHRPSPRSGQGRGLALVGAYVLADELGRAPDGDHRVAYARTGGRTRPLVDADRARATEDPGGPAAQSSVDRAERALGRPSPPSRPAGSRRRISPGRPYDFFSGGYWRDSDALRPAFPRAAPDGPGPGQAAKPDSGARGRR